MKYKIDFNNGKVFIKEKDFANRFIFDQYAYLGSELRDFGATITEIKEPMKFECDVRWEFGGYGGITYPVFYNEPPKTEHGINSFAGKKGRLVFTEFEE